MGKKRVSESDEEGEMEEQEIEENNEIQEFEEENYENESNDKDDSFDKKNNDILNDPSDSEEGEINAWGSDKKLFYKFDEEVHKYIFIYSFFILFIIYS
jgi:hypothetical protein